MVVRSLLLLADLMVSVLVLLPREGEAGDGACFGR